MLKYKIWVAAVAGALATAAATGNARVEQLGWLAGHWTTEKDGQSTEESWLAPRGGSMVGVGRTSDASTVHFWELLKIDTDEDGVVTYWAAPMGGKPTAFRLTQASAGEAIFENPAHDFPTRIHYRLDGKFLIATVSGTDGVNRQSWRYRRARR